MRRAAGLPPVAISLLAALGAGACLAGRPLTVDDANVNDPGVGHIETYAARDPGGVRTWTLAPAWGLRDGVELSAGLSRDASNRVHTTALQAKLLWAPARPDGCNSGTVFGLAHTSKAGGNTAYVNGLLTCNHEALAFHANLGAIRPHHGPALATWGLALERTLGAVTVHAESFGQRHAKPVVQIGARTDLAKDIQLDGTIGRHNRGAVYSAGLKFGF